MVRAIRATRPINSLTLRGKRPVLRNRPWMAVSRLSPQPVAFYAAVFFFVNVTYILLIWELIEPRADVPSRVRRSMRYRSIATLSLFAIAALVALKYPFLGLGICCCCLVGYLRPDAPGAERRDAI